MNMLNSLIIEGVIKSVTHDEDNGVLPCTQFTIETYRELKTRTEVSEFTIKCFGRLAEVTKSVEKDRELRVVGRLKREKGDVLIIAEHIEIKPKKE